MSQMKRAMGATAWRSVFLACVLASTADAFADDTVECDVGMAVKGEMAGGKVGEIAEIGESSPHRGWYRVIYDWTPSGEWYDPGTWELYRADTGERCLPASNPAAERSTRSDPDPATARPANSEGASRPPASTTTAPVASTAPTQSTARCPAGAARSNRKGQAVSVIGESNGLCVIRNANGSVESIPHWMLSDPPQSASGTRGPAAASDALPAGSYVCTMPGAGQFPIVILDASTYQDRAGDTGRYRLEGDRLSFDSGSLEGQYSKRLGPAKFGLSTDQDRMFYGVCNLKR